MMAAKQRIFILGSQGIPVRYGGLETFAQELALRLVDRGWEVWVSCEKAQGEADGPNEWNGVNLFYVEGPAGNRRTIVADRRAFEGSIQRGEPGDVVYLLGYGVGPFALPLIRSLRKAGMYFWLNPDGLEWQRPRWSIFARAYLRLSERLLLRAADRVICDAEAIRDFHAAHSGVKKDRMDVIEYGAPLVETPAATSVDARDEFLDRHGLRLGQYYTYVGRFVPDNNMELMVRGALASVHGRRLLVCASVDENDPFYRHLLSLVETSESPARVVFAGGIYDRDLLIALRLGQFAYFHGHEVGGTNPALVEAMGLGSPVVALSTVYNREVLAEGAVYFDKSVESFLEGLDRLERMSSDERTGLQRVVRERVRGHYNWDRIAGDYERLLRAAWTRSGR
jgi:rhamnosyltransferase